MLRTVVVVVVVVVVLSSVVVVVVVVSFLHGCDTPLHYCCWWWCYWCTLPGRVVISAMTMCCWSRERIQEVDVVATVLKTLYMNCGRQEALVVLSSVVVVVGVVVVMGERSDGVFSLLYHCAPPQSIRRHRRLCEYFSFLT